MPLPPSDYASLIEPAFQVPLYLLSPWDRARVRVRGADCHTAHFSYFVQSVGCNERSELHRLFGHRMCGGWKVEVMTLRVD